MRFLLVLLGLAASASADVIVYKGTAHASLPGAVSQFGPLPHVYVVFDLSSKNTYFLFYYTLAGQKKSQNLPPLNPTHYVAQAASSTKTVGSFSFVLDNSMGADVGVNMFFLRGTVKGLELSTNGGGTFANYPKTMTGIFREAQQIGATPSLFEFNFTLSFDPYYTQRSNNLFKTGDATAKDIGADLSLKGY